MSGFRKPVRMGPSILTAEPCLNLPTQEAKHTPTLGTTHRNLLLHKRLYWVDTQPVSTATAAVTEKTISTSISAAQTHTDSTHNKINHSLLRL